MTIPTITTIIDPPLPTDAPAIFDQKAFAAWADLNTWADQANATATQINTDADRVNDPAVQAVASNLVSIVAVANNKTNIDRVSANQANINVVSANDANIKTVSGISSQVTTVAGMKTTVEAVNNNKANIDNVAGNKANIDNVAGNKTNINTVAGNSANVTTVASNISSVNTTAGNMAAVIDAPIQATKAQTQATLADGYRQQAAASSTTATSAAVAASSSAGIAQTAAASAQAIVWEGATGYPKIRPSLLLDFANSKTVDPRITFTRASTASYWDDKGILRQALAGQPRIDHDPATGECKGLLIEESRTNVIVYSENLEHTAWEKNSGFIFPSNIVSPNGRLASRKFVASSSNSEHYVRSLGVSLPAGTYTASVYVHNSSEFNLYLRPVHGGEAATTSQVIFYPATGLLSSVSGNGVSAGSKYVGNGWWRVWLVFTLAGTRTAQFGFQTYLSSPIHIGDGNSGVVVWGAQLEAGSFPTSYIPTPATFTSRASVGTYFDSTGLLKTAAINEARYDHGLVDGVWVPKGLLLEPQRTNIVQFSQELNRDTYWARASVNVLEDNAVAPDGTNTADKLNEIVISSSHGLSAVNALEAGKTYCISICAKAAERKAIILGTGPGTLGGSLFLYGKFDLVTGESTNFLGVPTKGIQALGNGWFRCYIVFTSAVTGSVGSFNVQILADTDNIYMGEANKGLYLWGAQLEEIPAGQSPEPTSYIKTEATAVTRSADVSTSSAVTRAADPTRMLGENFSNWWNTKEGTFLVKTNKSYYPSKNAWVIAVEKNGSNRISLNTNNNIVDYQIFSDNKDTFETMAGPLLDGVNSFAMAYKENDSAICVNGEAPIKDTSTVIPVGLNTLVIGNLQNNLFYLNGHIQKIAYYPKRLPNEQLQALTAE